MANFEQRIGIMDEESPITGIPPDKRMLNFVGSLNSQYLVSSMFINKLSNPSSIYPSEPKDSASDLVDNNLKNLKLVNDDKSFIEN